MRNGHRFHIKTAWHENSADQYRCSGIFRRSFQGTVMSILYTVSPSKIIMTATAGISAIEMVLIRAENRGKNHTNFIGFFAAGFRGQSNRKSLCIFAADFINFFFFFFCGFSCVSGCRLALFSGDNPRPVCQRGSCARTTRHK